MLVGCGTGDLGVLLLFPALVLLFSSFFFLSSAINLQGCLTLTTPPAFQATFTSGGVTIAWGARGERARRIHLPTWRAAMKRPGKKTHYCSIPLWL